MFNKNRTVEVQSRCCEHLHRTLIFFFSDRNAGSTTRLWTEWANLHAKNEGGLCNGHVRWFCIRRSFWWIYCIKVTPLTWIYLYLEPCWGRLSSVKHPSCRWLDASQQVKNLESGVYFLRLYSRTVGFFFLLWIPWIHYQWNHIKILHHRILCNF